MKIFLGSFLIAVGLLAVRTQPNAGFPEAMISNGLVTAKLLLPDAEKGYYRGSRFDWAGVIGSLDYKGHSYFGQWYEKYDPFLHDAIMGPVDEFRDPLGYKEAKPGEEFVKIGVGTLRKPDDGKYSFSKKYEHVDPGIWKVSKEKDRVTFRQELKGVRGFSYTYEKTVRLAPGKPLLVLEHRLTNNGTRRIRTSTYNHNFFMIDQEPTGPGILTSFAFEVDAHGRGFGDIAHTKDKSIVYGRELQKGEHVFSEDLKAAKNIPAPYSFTVENRKTGAGVRVNGDKPIDTMVYWACPTTACPEPYLDLSLEPGMSADWQITYEFYQNPVK